jgi:hypothetical protein
VSNLDEYFHHSRDVEVGANGPNTVIKDGQMTNPHTCFGFQTAACWVASSKNIFSTCVYTHTLSRGYIAFTCISTFGHLKVLFLTPITRTRSDLPGFRRLRERDAHKFYAQTFQLESKICICSLIGS